MLRHSTDKRSASGRPDWTFIIPALVARAPWPITGTFRLIDEVRD